MMRNPENRFIIISLLSFIFLVSPFELRAKTRFNGFVSEKGSIVKILSVTAKENSSGITVMIRFKGRIQEQKAKTLDSPPRIYIDIPCVPSPLKQMIKTIKSPYLKSIRIGYHPDKIRVVLDIKTPDIPPFKIRANHNALTISLQRQGALPEAEEKKELIASETAPKSEEGDSPTVVSDRSFAFSGTQDPVDPPHDPNTVIEKLLKMEADDGKSDTASFLKGLNAYKRQNWPRAIENLEHLIKKYPEGRYTERACFLLAKSYEQFYSGSLLANFRKIKGHYEDAISRFPSSIYVADALLSIGELCSKVKDYDEALGYYNLVLKKHTDPTIVQRALIEKAYILRLEKKLREALSVLEEVILRNPGLREEIEAKVEMAKVLYEMHSFRRSLSILSDLQRTRPENLHKYPEVALYLGYNYHQLGDNPMARENLFRFYNICPERKINHLILTHIGDTYREQGLKEDAAKLYRLVIKRYPNTEGAVISRIRLAEQQEKGEIVLGDTEAGSPKKIYEDITKDLLRQDKENPLIQLAMLKLAIVQQKEKHYRKSLKLLKALLEKYPRTKLRNEITYTLRKVLEAILESEMKRQRYVNVINIYQGEEKLFSTLNAPELFLTVARASIHLNLQDTAIEMFEKSEPLLMDREKPPDLLFFLGEASFKKGDFKKALTRLDLLIANHPSENYLPYAYQLKGRILFKQKKYQQASELFSLALRDELKPCDRSKILIEKARVLMAGNLNEDAIEAVREAHNVTKSCHNSHNPIYQEIGDLYLHLGYPEEALFIFDRILKEGGGGENRIGLKFLMARCYEALNKKEKYLALYNQIMSLHDPFWSNLAKERVEEINFEGIVREKGQK